MRKYARESMAAAAGVRRVPSTPFSAALLASFSCTTAENHDENERERKEGREKRGGESVCVSERES